MLNRNTISDSSIQLSDTSNSIAIIYLIKILYFLIERIQFTHLSDDGYEQGDEVKRVLVNFMKL